MATEINEIEYKDGFNRGYWLFNYEPDVAKLLKKSTKDKTNDFSIGFTNGLKQAEQERTLSEFEQLRNKSNEQDMNIER
ncbi:MAG TPA: hypothetical protein PK431_08300 [Chitinophagales bacterium]|jgi:hypothetical protein|nr:hypothetical protein [Chitinophagales bacterium]